MSASRQEIHLQLLQIIDAALFVLALWLAYWLRVVLGDVFRVGDIPPFAEFVWLAALAIPFGPLILEIEGFYQKPLQQTIRQCIVQILRTMLWLTILVAICVIFFRFDVPSRAVTLIFIPVIVGFLLSRRYFWESHLRGKARLGELKDAVILAGPSSEVLEFESGLQELQRLQMKIVYRLDLETEPISELTRQLHLHSVNRVIFVGSKTGIGTLQQAIAACETEGVEAWMVADFIKTAIARPSFDMFGNRPMLVFRTTPDASWALLFKRVIDITGALAGLILLSPLLFAVAIMIKISSPGPILFTQQRGGKNGRPFTMFKFRSMVADAESQKEKLQERNEMSGPVFKIHADPRVTSLGRWLRRTSVDELPQLWNVLRGEMSLVGPRPLPIYEVQRFEDPGHRRRLSVKPGLTCLWQIRGRNDVRDFADWVRLDLEYIDNWSLLLDFKILLLTIPAVLWQQGAK